MKNDSASLEQISKNQQNYQQMSKMKISAKILVKIYQQYKMFNVCDFSEIN